MKKNKGSIFTFESEPKFDIVQSKYGLLATNITQEEVNEFCEKFTSDEPLQVRKSDFISEDFD